MGLDLYYYVEGIDKAGVLENISPLEGPTEKNAYRHVDMVNSNFRYLYGTAIPVEDSIPRSTSLYDKLRSGEYASSVDLEGVSYLSKISQLTRDMLVHFSDVQSALILYLSDLEEIYKNLEDWDKHYLSETMEKLRKYEKEGYKKVKIVFYFD
jgi:hypothetical protein